MDDFVRRKLKDWGLSHLQNTFHANRIDEEAFNSLNKKLIKDLIVAVRDRIRFSKLHELYLQESCPVKAEIFFQNVPEDTLFKTENDDDSVQSDQDNSTSILDSQNDEMMNYPDTSSSHTVLSSADSQNVLSLLNEDLRGKEVLHLYQHSNAVNYSKLSSVLIERKLLPDPSARITKETFISWSKGCSEIFTKELPETFYSYTKERTGGILYEKYLNKRRTLKELGMIKPKRIKGEEPVAIVEESTDLLDYLQNHSEPLSEIIFRWEKTVSLRALKRKEMSIADYFDRFKALLRPNGYILMDIDFKFLHSGHENKLFEKWPSIAKKLIIIARNKVELLKEKEKCMDKCEISNFLIQYDDVIKRGKIEVVSFLLLPLLIQIASFKTPSGITWRPTVFEVQKGFIAHALTNDEVHPILKNRTKAIERYKLVNQPFPVLIGPVDEIVSAKIKMYNVDYEMPNALKAVDSCFKAFSVLNAQYPPESKQVWSFLQRYVYEIEDAKTKKYTAVNKLISTLTTL